MTSTSPIRPVPARPPGRTEPDVVGGPALLTGDEGLAEQVRSLAAAAGVELRVLRHPPSRLDPGLVLVGSDLARQVARLPRARGSAPVVVAHEVGSGGPTLWEHAVALGAEQVVLLPQGRAWLVDRLARTGETQRRGRVLAVVSGCGGAGGSVLAGALAVRHARRRRPVLLVDLDPFGGGVDLVVGAGDVSGLRWPDLAAARGRVPAAGLHAALPQVGDLAVLGWGRGEPLDLPVGAVESVLDAGTRSHDLVVLDLPRAWDPPAAAAARRADELLVVVPSRVRAVAAAAQLLEVIGPQVASVRVVVRRHADDRLSAGQVCDALGLPLAAQMRDEPRLDALLHRGEAPGLRPRSNLAQAADQCLGDVAAFEAA
jgi:secretion/DNA translocation related CpaE-like protein